MLILPVSLVSQDGSTNNNLDTCNTSIDFIWQTVSNATRYQVQISKDSLFGTTVAGGDVYETGFANTDFTYNFTEYGTYFWRVRAWDEQADASCPGAWSDVWQINIRHIYLLTTLNSPINNDPDCAIKPTFNWDIIPGSSVTKYHIQGFR